MFDISFDPASISEIARFYGMATLLSAEVQTAMQEGGDLLTAAAVANTWAVFDHPSGELAGTIHPVMMGPYEVMIGSDDPKARRREKGFSGMTDAIGRYYANDPAKPYMQPALDDNDQAAMTLIEAAAGRAFARLGGA
jgi:hypothetical protein